MLRVGVVPIKDSTGQSLPTDSMQLGLLSEFARNQIDTVVLSADSPLKDVESEARAKQCDYFVFTVPTVLKDPEHWRIGARVFTQRSEAGSRKLPGPDPCDFI